MNNKKVVYYSDLNNDDFAKTKLKIVRKPLPEKYEYLHKKNIFFRFFGMLLYRIAMPFVWLYVKIFWGQHVAGKKRLKRSHIHGGYFLYGNHTQEVDGVLPHATIANPRRTYTICHSDAVNIPGIKTIVKMLGALPLPESPAQSKRFLDAVEYHYKKGHVILIYPEAHIWPYTTLIRDFKDASFTYPAQLNAPVVAFCNTYKKRKVLRNLPPRIITHISAPIYPDTTLPLGERAHDLREQVHNFMVDCSGSLDNYEYVRYIYKEKKE